MKEKIPSVQKARLINEKLNIILKSLPFSDESNLETKINELLFNFKTDVRVYFTSGTTRKPKALYFNSEDVRNISEYIKWFCKVEGIAGKEKVAVLMDHSFWGTGYFTSLGHNAAGNTVIPIDLSLKEGIKEILESVAPTVISTLPSKLEEYADILPKNGLKIIETTGEIMTSQKRKALERMFNAEIFDAYGLTEGVVGVECREHNGYHYREDKIIIEIKDRYSEKILKDGQTGEIVITNLMCHTQPIIRYKTGDVGRIVRERCSCGLDHPRIIVKGRLGKTYWLKDGARLTEENIRKSLESVLGFSPPFEVNMNVKKGCMRVMIESEFIQKEKVSKIVKIISESNFDVYNIYKAQQLQIIIETKQ